MEELSPKEELHYKENHHIVVESVLYDKEKGTFTFDFGSNNHSNKVELLPETHKIDAFGRCFYYSYEFSPDLDSSIRTQFIRHIKFEEDFSNSDDFKCFINNAVNSLDKEICLPLFKAFIYPKSMSELNRKLLSSLSRLSSPDVIEIEMIKELPQNILFDYERYHVEVLDALQPDGRPRFTEQAKNEAISIINEIMDDIHKKDYFSIARDVKKARYRNYIKNFYKFENEQFESIYRKISNSNVLLFDDIVTTGTTIYHLLNCLRCVNDSNNIAIYSLIGNDKVKDLF